MSAAIQLGHDAFEVSGEREKNMARWILVGVLLSAMCLSANAQTRPTHKLEAKAAHGVQVVTKRPSPAPEPTLAQAVQDLTRAVAELRVSAATPRISEGWPPVTLPVGHRCFGTMNACAETICSGFNYSHGYYSEVGGDGFVTCYRGKLNDAVSTTMK